MTNVAELREAPLISASRLLAERGYYGIVWVDAELRVTAKYGELVGFVEIGASITASVLPLMGLEADIRMLQRKPQSVVDIPSVTIIGEQRTPRLNIAVIWSRAERCYLVLASRAVLRSDLEMELNRQIRARLIAEADVDAKSAQLQRANLELARTNADLEQFASVISHDLKSPMRVLRFLAEDAEAQLKRGDVAAGLGMLEAMRAQTQRMSQMLSALLDYASAGRKADTLKSVDTRELVGAVVKALPRREAFVVTVKGNWPTITTHAALLDLVLRNLIENALAHHDRASGNVDVTGEELGEELHISVSDDGPGIEARHHAAIFLPFRTLRSKGNGSDSTGMGLPLVTRAVDAVGGHIEVLSHAPEVRGATFRVRWPKSLKVSADKTFDFGRLAGYGTTADQ